MTSNYNSEQLEFERLEKECEDMKELIQRLKEKIIIETDESIRFKYEKEIEEANNKLNDLTENLSWIKGNSLYRSLLNLNYKKQENLFFRFVRNHPISSFLIYGAKDHGQDWLINKLLHKIGSGNTYRPIRIDLRSAIRNSNVQEIWKELGRHFGGIKDTPEMIIQRILRRWKTQNICIVIDGVDFITKDLFEQLLENLWSPLATEAQYIVNKQHSQRLLMFFIGNNCCIENWDVHFTEEYAPNWQFSSTIKLPILNSFERNVIEEWINDNFYHLPNQIIDNDVNVTIERIWEYSEGIPLYALQEICNLCDCDWHETWLKL